MGNNVIILGAGFSKPAGIPLLSEFLQSMWEMAVLERCNDQTLSREDVEIFKQAAQSRNFIDGYHGRAHFDDRNIEDVLSILSFGVMAGSKEVKKHFTALRRGISRTIELKCTVKHSGIPRDQQQWSIEKESHLYTAFWKSLFQWKLKGNTLPTIITLNYDLVLERSLLQLLINRHYTSESRPSNFIRVNYHYPDAPQEVWELQRCRYNSTRGDFSYDEGTNLVKATAPAISSVLEIDLLKLHGSLNFSENKL